MNKYEAKFKEQWLTAQQRVVSSEADKVKLEGMLADNVKNIVALDRALDLLKENQAFEAAQALKDKLASLHKDRSALENRVKNVEESINNAKKKVKFMMEICPHEHMVFDHEDYHKGEEFHRCTLCGTVR